MNEHALAQYIRRDLKAAVAAHVASTYKVGSSPGQFNTWSQTPFVAIYDRAVTTSAQRGYYVVYLFRGDGSSVFLSLNQATTEVQAEFKADYLEVLESRADFGRGLLAADLGPNLILEPLDLGGTSDLSKGYEKGNIVAREYVANSMPNDQDLAKHLQEMMDLYTLYKAATIGRIGSGDDEPDDLTSWEEKKRFRWHRKAERDRKLAQKAKEHHGYVCQVCQFDFEAYYGSRGSEYIEAHHIEPFASLMNSPEPAVLDYRHDFAVVCANCHRMLHRKPLLKPDELKSMILSPVTNSGSD